MARAPSELATPLTTQPDITARRKRKHDKAQTRSVAINDDLTYLMYSSGLKSCAGYQKACDLSLLSVIEDFNALMKTGRPEYYIPSASTISRDVKQVFTKVRGRIAKVLQVRIKSAT